MPVLGLVFVLLLLATQRPDTSPADNRRFVEALRAFVPMQERGVEIAGGLAVAVVIVLSKA